LRVITKFLSYNKGEKLRNLAQIILSSNRRSSPRSNGS